MDSDQPSEAPAATMRSGPDGSVLRVLVRADSDGERTQRTLAGLLAAAPARVSVTVVAAPSHPLVGRQPRARVHVVAASGGSPLSLTGCAESDPLVVVEDGAIVPRDWAEIIEAHLAARPPVGVLAATTNHASGPERIDTATSDQPHRLTPARWQCVASDLAERWRAVREDMEFVSTPLFVVTRPEECSDALEHWWNDEGHAPLELAANARLALARDLAVWREPGRGRAHLAVEVRDPIEHIETLSPPSLVRRAAALAATSDGESPRVHRHLAECFVRLGDYSAATEHARACLRAWPQNVDAKLWLAESLTRTGELPRARRALEELQQELPLAPRRKAHLLACMGELWRLEGGALQAEQCLDAALELDPLQPLALDARGLLDLEAGHFDGSLRAFRRAVRADPYYASGWSDYGRALVMSGEVERARTALGRALALRPQNREARRLLVRISSTATPA